MKTRFFCAKHPPRVTKNVDVSNILGWGSALGGDAKLFLPPPPPFCPFLLLNRLSKKFNYDRVVMVGDGATDMQVSLFVVSPLPLCRLRVSMCELENERRNFSHCLVLRCNVCCVDSTTVAIFFSFLVLPFWYRKRLCSGGLLRPVCGFVFQPNDTIVPC